MQNKQSEVWTRGARLHPLNLFIRFASIGSMDSSSFAILLHAMNSTWRRTCSSGERCSERQILGDMINVFRFGYERRAVSLIYC